MGSEWEGEIKHSIKCSQDPSQLREKMISHPFNKPSKKLRLGFCCKVSLRFTRRVVQLATPCTDCSACWLCRVDATKEGFQFPRLWTLWIRYEEQDSASRTNKQKSRKRSLPYYHQVFGNNNNYRGFHITIQISKGTTEPRTASYPSLNNEHRKHEIDAACEM